MTPNPTVRPHSLAEDLLGPVRAPRGTARRRILLARSAVAHVGLIATAVQVVVWLLIAVLTAHLDSPWWLWTAGPAAAAVGALTLADHWVRLRHPVAPEESS